MNQSIESIAHASLSEATRTSRQMFDRVRPTFDLTSVQCEMERNLREGFSKDQDLMQRIAEASTEALESRRRTQIHLITHGYQVDCAITPKLHQLGIFLSRILRLSHPMDVYVVPSVERNAFCLPSRKGNRLIMCLNAGLLSGLSRRELLFVMAHEVGHAILSHGDIPSISFDHSNFSPLEVMQIRALDRAQEISCDRFGLLVCQNLRVASTALFKIASGLSERWITFDEMAYAKHFDRLSSMAELVDLEDALSTHPLVPLRVKALIAYSNSELYANAFGRHGASIASQELESTVETMLSVRLPDLTELKNAEEKTAFNQMLFDGALLVMSADGVIDLEEVSWLESLTDRKWSREEITEQLENEQFVALLNQRVERNAKILRHKLPELKRAGILHAMCDVALISGGIPKSEFEILNRLRQALGIRPELAQSVIERVRREKRSDKVSPDRGRDIDIETESDSLSESSDPLEKILIDAKLPVEQLTASRMFCDSIRTQDVTLVGAFRRLISWAIQAGRRGGPLTKTHAKRIAIAAVTVLRELQEDAGEAFECSSTPIERQIRKYGVIALFRRGESVMRESDSEPCVIMSVSRTRKRLKISPATDSTSVQEVAPDKLIKDPVHGSWPPELT